MRGDVHSVPVRERPKQRTFMGTTRRHRRRLMSVLWTVPVVDSSQDMVFFFFSQVWLGLAWGWKGNSNK